MSAINNYILKTPSPRTRKPPNPVETLNWKSLKVDLDNNTAHFEVTQNCSKQSENWLRAFCYDF